jgi:hypothetical protein
VPGARLWHHTARRHPPELRHAARARRRQRRARRGLPARAHRRLAAPCRRAAAVSSSGQFPVHRAALHRPDLLGGRTPRTINMSTIGDDLLREASPGFGPKVEALVVYNSNPVAVAPESAQGGAGLCARRPVHRGAGAFPDRHGRLRRLSSCPPPRSWSTGTCTWLRPHRRAAQPPGHRPGGPGAPNTQIFRDLAARMGFTDPCFADSDETLCRRPLATRWTLT